MLTLAERFLKKAIEAAADDTEKVEIESIHLSIKAHAEKVKDDRIRNPR